MMETVSTVTMHHTNTIAAAMRADWDSATYVDGKSENGYDSFYWTIWGKNREHISVKYCLANKSVIISTVDSPRKDGKGYHYMDPEKSKPIKRLCLALLMADIPCKFTACFLEE